MLAFNGGEQSGRFATVVMELKGYLEEHGVNWRDPKAIAAHPDIASEAMFSAKRLMEKTFFKYDALRYAEDVLEARACGTAALPVQAVHHPGDGL